jgi:drug/metabolite transporter (DMT)-like permease
VAALIQNLSPLITAVLSYFFLKKGLTKLETGVLIVSFLGVVLLITGKAENNKTPDPLLVLEEDVLNVPSTADSPQVDSPIVLMPIILMLFVPLLNSIITLLFA